MIDQVIKTTGYVQVNSKGKQRFAYSLCKWDVSCNEYSTASISNIKGCNWKISSTE